MKKLWLIFIAYTLLAGGCAVVPERGDFVRVKDYENTFKITDISITGRWLWLEDWEGSGICITRYEIEEVIK